ncbi:hypothetical protein [Nostoc sp. 'Peltigera membranacea cyanobiont' 210A]|uniref:hypothetical protein n=1 Tax=Nostoc sp. 'Peltigera membranacea cyanobiont' 210A TaxID=2014529 RepID=UPI001CB8A70C|nr:hypothetical protein [Nostoc sp. 'Peltigera membranacea cyanobiont' 210A]
MKLSSLSLVPQGGSQKLTLSVRAASCREVEVSKVKRINCIPSFLRRLKWYVYLRHAVLVRSLVPEIRCKSDLIFEKITYS